MGPALDDDHGILRECVNIPLNCKSDTYCVLECFFVSLLIANACVTQTPGSTLQQPVGEGDEPVPQGTDTLAIIWNTV